MSGSFECFPRARSVRRAFRGLVGAGFIAMLAAVALGSCSGGTQHNTEGSATLGSSAGPVATPSPIATDQPTATPTPVPVKAAFSPTGSMVQARRNTTATLLPDGRVLIAGGDNGKAVLAAAELYDPTTGTFTATGSMALSRVGHTATLLPDGRVLVAGGASASAELYDSTTGKFSPTGSMAHARNHHTATLLNDGLVLIAGGGAGAELYDPSTGKFSPTGSMAHSRYSQTATLLSDGRVLFTGGRPTGTVAGVFASAELYDPTTAKFTATGSMAQARTTQAATLLRDGRVLIVGGYNFDAKGAVTLASAELYDQSTGAFSPTASMAHSRAGASATLLADGRVLVMGPIGAELYDPASGTFSAAAPVETRGFPTATLLADGRVLIAGGIAGLGGALSTADLYQPGS